MTMAMIKEAMIGSLWLVALLASTGEWLL